MDLDLFAERFPRLFHATFEENTPGIMRRGLLCAQDLVSHSGLSAQATETILSERRADLVEIALPGGDTAILRDQIPLRLSHLKQKYPHISTNAYCRNLSRRLFFWCSDIKRTATSGREYRGRRQDTLVFDTAKLLRDHADRIELCRVNSGTLLMPSAVGSEENRNPATMFVRIRECSWAMASIKEVTLVGSLLDPERYLADGSLT